eukprot:5928976-Amphidinium_carterae.1
MQLPCALSLLFCLQFKQHDIPPNWRTSDNWTARKGALASVNWDFENMLAARITVQILTRQEPTTFRRYTCQGGVEESTDRDRRQANSVCTATNIAGKNSEVQVSACEATTHQEDAVR